MTTGKLVNINTTFRNTEASDSVRQYAEEKLENCLKKFVHQDTDARVVLIVEKNRHIAEVSFRTNGADFNGKEESENLYASIDALVDSIGRQLKRHKEKVAKRY